MLILVACLVVLVVLFARGSRSERRAWGIACWSCLRWSALRTGVGCAGDTLLTER